MPKQKPSKLNTKVPVKVKSGDKVETIGVFNEETNTVTLKLSSKQSKNYSEGKWQLYTSYLNHLVKLDAVIIIDDEQTKWKFKINAVDFKYYSKEIGNFSACNSVHFEVLKASKWTTVIECKSSECKSNMANCCLKGSVKIGSDGRCGWL